jgi:predicted GIY-YIG superfamily endonuclease
VAFYVYVLACSDGSLYVGHTDDLAARLSAHRGRRYAGYTASQLPVRLVFSEPFNTRDEAFAAERRIKGMVTRQEASAGTGRIGPARAAGFDKVTG